MERARGVWEHGFLVGREQRFSCGHTAVEFARWRGVKHALCDLLGRRKNISYPARLWGALARTAWLGLLKECLAKYVASVNMAGKSPRCTPVLHTRQTASVLPCSLL